MGIVIKSNMLVAEKDTCRLLVYCSAPSNIRDNAISINTKLAEKLIPMKPSRRTIRLERCFNEIIDSRPDRSVIKDIDVLFNPDYKIDVFKMLTASCKRKKFDLIWSGKLEDNSLIYSEEGFSDYHKYEIDCYDIVCVV